MADYDFGCAFDASFSRLFSCLPMMVLTPAQSFARITMTVCVLGVDC